MVHKETIREIRFSDYEEVKTVVSAGKWLKYPRKKVQENDVYKLLKVDGKKAVYQLAANKLKKFFKITPMCFELIWDLDNNTYGGLYVWEETIGHIGKCNFWLKDTENMKEIIKIVLFDNVIANNDRTVVNVLVKKDFKILAIDEGEAFRYNKAPIKCKFRKEIYLKLKDFVLHNNTWFEVYVKELIGLKYEMVLAIMEEVDDDCIVECFTNRMDSIQLIANQLFYGK